MSEKLANIAQSIGVQAMGSVVDILEDFFEFFGVNSVDCAETLSEQAIKFFISSLLGTAIEEHMTN